ncbi:MAG: hypothetical protein HDQ97_15600 [Lachnospiraceae bacterium]|nr:hypothetical protein [Lachnospiraceae bacterium]
MKKIMKLFLICGLFVCFAAGCADVAEDSSSKEKISVCSAQMLETLDVTEEGYYIMEGNLYEIGKHTIALEMEDGQLWYFQMAPETIVYAGENRELGAGQAIKIVFEGNLNGTGLENISVIAVMASEEEL